MERSGEVPSARIAEHWTGSSMTTIDQSGLEGCRPNKPQADMECCPPKASSKPLSSAGFWRDWGRWKLKYRRCSCKREHQRCCAARGSHPAGSRCGQGVLRQTGQVWAGWRGASFNGGSAEASFPVALLGVPLSQHPNPDPQAEFAAGVRGAHERPVPAVSRGGWWGVGSHPRRHRGHAGLTTTSTRSSRSVCRKS